MTAAVPSSPPTASNPSILERADPLLVSLAELLDGIGRDDLSARLRAARVRIARPASVVCVVGEFKQGKSSFVNAAIGRSVCPVDDDISTAALTLVRYGEEPAAIVRSTIDGQASTTPIQIADVAAYVTESAPLRPGQRVERVDVVVPSELLAGGLALVDTPGAGGMAGGHAAATLGFLPFADGLVFVTDLTSELTAPEIDFLRRSRERCPNVLVVETKSDLFPQWRRIHELNLGHLRRLGLELPVIPVSSVLADVGRDRGDDELMRRSGLPEFRERLIAEVVAPAKAGAVERALGEARAAIDVAMATVQAERAAIDDPAELERLAADAASTLAKLEQLRGPGARWNVVLGDRVTDASNEVNHHLRGAFREVSRITDESIEAIRTPEQWDELSQRLQSDVADAVSSAFIAAEQARQAIRSSLAELIAFEELSAAPYGDRGAPPLDVLTMWRHRETQMTSAGTAVRSGLTGLRGAQGGVMLLGLSGQFLPHAAGVFIMSNPVLLTVGAVFGGMQLFDERKRRIQARRQAARTQMRQFVDDVQFAIGNELGNLLRSIQRDLRDEFSSLVGELQRTWTDTARRAEETRSATAEQRTTRRRELDRVRQELTDVSLALDGIRA